MNTIKIYLAESGRVADLKKDFPLYQGQFQNKLLNIYVPTSILAPEFKTLSQGQTTSEYVAGTAVKMGMTYLARNGEIKVSKNYYMRYLKTLTYQNVEYAMFERKLPQEFTLYAGQGSNAPVLIINVVNVKTDVDPVEILSIITSQTCSLDVMASSSLDNDEAVKPSELETINARLNAIDQILPTKQDKTDEGLNTENKTIVGAINELKEDVDTNTTNITQNTEDIAKNKSDIDELKQLIGTGEEYIGTLNWESETLPTDDQLNAYVQQTVSRATKNGDVVIVVQKLQGKTGKNYKYIYADNGWGYYEIPSMALSSNGTVGLVSGTYNIGSTNNTIVDISGGQILNIYVKDASGTYRNIREYINANATSLANIINGNTSVGIALRAVADGLGNNIVNTYLTQTAGATKDFVRKYALPREFNDIFYISKDGYSKEIPTDVAPQFSVETNNIGDFTLFDIIKTNDCEYELSRKNSADNAIYISASRDCIVTFRLSTQARNVGQDWVDLDVELSNPISMITGQLQRVDFSSIFTYLGEKVLDLKVGDMLRQTLEVVMQEITPTTFNVYSNETYPSIFNINTLSQVVYHTLGKLGEQPVFELTPSGAITASGIALAGSDVAQLYNNVECQVIINIPIETQGYELFNENMSILGIELGGQSVRLATPYNFESGVTTFKNLRQVAHSQDAVNGITYTIKCFIKIGTGGDITFLVDEDNLDVVYDYPAIVFAESERQKSKNLFNENKYLSSYCTYASNKWTTNSSRIGYNQSILTNETGATDNRNTSKLPLLKKGTYTLTIFNTVNNTDDTSINIAFYNQDGTINGTPTRATITTNTSITFTLASDLYLDIRVTGKVGTISFNHIQIEQGSTVTEYQSYNGAIVHEKEIEDVEHIETIYDMSSSDSNINKGYTAGKQFDDKATDMPIDLGDYKKLRLCFKLYNQTIVYFDFGIPSNTYFTMCAVCMEPTYSVNNPIMLSVYYSNGNLKCYKAVLGIDAGGGNLNNSDNAVLIKVQGVK